MFNVAPCLAQRRLSPNKHTVILDLTIFQSCYKYCQRALTLLTYKHTPVDSVAKPGAGYTRLLLILVLERSL